MPAPPSKLSIIRLSIIAACCVLLCPQSLRLAAAQTQKTEHDAAQQGTANGTETRQDADKRQTKIRIAEETTVLTEPLTEEGYVDYIAGMNAILERGLTRDNNGAVDFVAAMDPKDEWGYHEALGIDKTKLPKPFQSWAEHVQATAPNVPPAVQNQLVYLRDTMAVGPWKSEQAPSVVRWLEANKETIDVLATATKKPRFYTPWGPDGSSVIEVLLPDVKETRELTRTLNARAMLRLGEGDIDGAWSDLQACHALARQVGSGPMVVERLVGIAIESVALSSDVVFIQNAALSPEEIERYQQILATMPRIPALAEVIDRAERFSFLDATQLIARDGASRLQMLVADPPEPMSRMLGRLVTWSVDWNETLIVGNQWYDRCVVIAQTDSVPQRRKRSAELERELFAATDGSELAKLFFRTGREKGRRLAHVILRFTLPALAAASNAESRAIDQRQLVTLAFAAEAYREKHDKYPARLDELAPQFIDKIPQDLFLEQPYRYETDGLDFRIFGAGFNFEFDDAVDGLDNVVSTAGWKIER